jgi:hypothetical protein
MDITSSSSVQLLLSKCRIFFREQLGRKLVFSAREEKQVKLLPTPITSEGTLLQQSWIQLAEISFV